MTKKYLVSTFTVCQLGAHKAPVCYIVRPRYYGHSDIRKLNTPADWDLSLLWWLEMREAYGD